ncbi:hypothetical protein QLX52_13815 [Streptomyces albus]|uniref:hypothetical protein n=1 Tax=Streptomyces TaxID=1883 RepID=UPI001CED1BD7|nr:MULTISPECIES: hypothetical protein [Streptomyces]MDI6409907.1 hypothetical protein [Streptomyces albus]
MNDSQKTTVLAAVVGGYLLGRTKKAKFALTVGSLVAGRRLGVAPQELLGSGLKKLTETPQFEELSSQVKEQLMSAARTAAVSLANRRISSLSSTLRDRTDRLGELAKPGGEQNGGGGGDGDEEGGSREQEEGAQEGRDEADQDRGDGEGGGDSGDGGDDGDGGQAAGGAGGERGQEPEERREPRHRQQSRESSARKRGVAREAAARSASPSAGRPHRKPVSGSAAKRSADRSARRR